MTIAPNSNRPQKIFEPVFAEMSPLPIEHGFGGKIPMRKLSLAVLVLLLPVALNASGVFLTQDAYTAASGGGNPAGKNFGSTESLLIDVGKGARVWLKFDLSTLPAGITAATVVRANLTVYVNGLTTAGTFDVFRVTGAWSEGTITHNTAPSLAPGAEVSGIAVAGAQRSIVVDVTGLVKDWLSGVLPNNGVALVAGNGSSISASFDAKENTGTSHPAQLEIIPEGPPGPQGPAGPQGLPGPQGFPIT
jgi:hypothetical protein